MRTEKLIPDCAALHPGYKKAPPFRTALRISHRA
jgi:hypothetical protein